MIRRLFPSPCPGEAVVHEDGLGIRRRADSCSRDRRDEEDEDMINYSRPAFFRLPPDFVSLFLTGDSMGLKQENNRYPA